MHLELEIRSSDGYTVVTPRGEIDLATYCQLKKTLGDLLVDGNIHLVVDLTETAFIDSTGLSALAGGRRKAYASNGSFALVCRAEQMLTVFRVTGLDMLFDIHQTLTEATSRPLTPLSAELERAVS
jgi:anti-sigma B factor antagonist